MALDSMAEIFEKAEAGGKPFWQVVLDTDMEERQVTAEASLEKMRATWRAMLESVETYQGDRRSVSGLVGGDGARMRAYAETGETLCGPYLREVIATALCVGESNACMRKIVAAPTAGSCGVIPAVLIPYQKRFGVTLRHVFHIVLNQVLSQTAVAFSPHRIAPFCVEWPDYSIFRNRMCEQRKKSEISISFPPPGQGFFVGK